jgi:hypothetical protein
MQDYLKAAVQAWKPSGAMACLDEQQIMAFYSGRLGESEMEMIRDHLAACSTCLELVRDAQQFLQAMGEPTQATPAALASTSTLPWYVRHHRELFFSAAALVITVSVGLLLGRGWRVEAPAEQQAETPSSPSSPTPGLRENPWRDLKIAKAEYTSAVVPPDDLTWRGGGANVPRSPKLSPFAQAMRPYDRNDFAEAEQRLAQFLEQNPGHAQAHFYRGVSLLLLGRTAEAIASLQTAIKHGPGGVSEEAHWYLALAYLKTGEPSKALGHLDAVVETSGKHHPQALQLRQQVRDTLR